jgi:CcmD family protein
VSYLWAGYGLTWLVLAAYAWRLERRRRTAETELSHHRASTGDDAADGDGLPR